MKMETVSIVLESPVLQFVEQQSQERHLSPQEMVNELLNLGFEHILSTRYQLYRQGKISFGRLAQDLGITTWELSHLIEDRGWPVHNLPATNDM
jgi:predicted HTH domain antitoxin